VVNLYPFDYDGLLMYAWSNLQIGKFKEAKILFNKVLMLSPNDKSALEGLAIINKK
jgi:Flp pilus assembly protein TadD